MLFKPQDPKTLRPLTSGRPGKIAPWAFGIVLLVQIAAIAVGVPSAGAVSSFCISALALIAAWTVLHRAALLAWEDRLTWVWSAAGIAFWAVAHSAHALLSLLPGPLAHFADYSGFLYVCAILPLLVAFATTRETQSMRAVFALNSTQAVLGLVLAWFLLYRTPHSSLVSPAAGRIFASACGLLAAMSVLRSLCWVSHEERNALRWVGVSLWVYLPIEVGIEFARFVGIKAGTFLDLAWAVPFGLLGAVSLALPVGPQTSQSQPDAGKPRLFAACACPLLLNSGIFALAAAVIPKHTVLGIASLAALLLVQGFQIAIVQMNFLAAGRLLCDRERALAESEQALRLANAGLKQLAMVDPLTGIANRRRFDSEFDAAWRRAERRRHSLVLLLLDVDYFKALNDHHGHAYGDECLVDLGHAVTEQARRPDDFAARIGGGEFVLILPETDEAGAATVAFNLHEAIRELGRAHYDSPAGRLTVSIGFALANPAVGSNPFSLMEAAEKALSQAKERGRNRTCSISVQQLQAAGQR